MKFTVKRSEWLRGKGAESSLLDCNNKKCCLGFLALACGATKEQIDGQGSPSDTVGVSWPTALYLGPMGLNPGQNTKICQSIIDVNDDEHNSNDELASNSDFIRETNLAKLFADIGIDVTFED